MLRTDPARQGVLLVSAASDLVGDYSCWLADAYCVTVARTQTEVQKELEHTPEIIILIEKHSADFGISMPELVAAALEKGALVIRLTDDTYRFDSRWGPHVIHLPLGVRPAVLLAAMKGFHSKEAGG